MLVPLDTKDPISVFDHEEAIAFLVTKGGRRKGGSKKVGLSLHKKMW